MKVKMLVSLSGMKDGAEWPRRGAVVDVTAVEAADLVACGLAEKVGAAVEAATAAPVETATKRTAPRARKG